MNTLTIPAADVYTLGDKKYFKVVINNVQHRDICVDIAKNIKPTLEILAKHMGATQIYKLKKAELIDVVSANIVFE